MGVVGTSVRPSPAAVSALAPIGRPGVSTTGQLVEVHLAAPAGKVSIILPGPAGHVTVVAPVPALVAETFTISATATIEFGAWGTSQRRVWMGYGVVNTMNLQYKPPGET